MDDKLIINNDYLVRKPLLSLNSYYDYLLTVKIDNSIEESLLVIDRVRRDPILLELIITTSINLYNKIMKIDLNTSNKDIKNVSFAVKNYINRFVSRTTPFNLSTVISKGSFLKNKVNKEKEVKLCRVDSEWASKIIKKINENELYREELLFRSSNRLITRRNRIIIYSVDGSMVSMKKNEIIEFIILHAKDYISLNMLIKMIREKFPTISENNAIKYINRLIDLKLLESELNLSYDGDDFLESLIYKLKSKKSMKFIELISKLIDISTSVDKYSKKCIGDGIADYKNLINKMKLLSESSNYIEVKLFLPEAKNLISPTKKSEIVKTVNFINKISFGIGFKNNLQEYKNRFIDKYGYERPVKLLDLLDNDSGIGLPASYLSDGYLLDSELSPTLVKNMLLGNSWDKDGEIILQDDILKTFPNYEKKANTNIHSFDIGLQMYNNTFVINPGTTSANSGRAMGRYKDVLNFKDSLMVKETDVASVFISENFIDGKANSLQNCRKKNSFVLTSAANTKNKELSLNEVYIGINKRNHSFYSYSSELNREFNVILDNPISPHVYSNELRFLMDISQNISQNINKFLSILYLEDREYQPRITYSNIIFCPERWVFSTVNSIKNFEIDLFSWKEKWGIPNIVYVVDNGQKLLINFDDEEQALHNLKKVFKKNNSVTLEETIFKKENSKENDRKKYLYESVFSVTNINHRPESNFNQIETMNMADNIDQERTMLPTASNWLYFKLAGNIIYRNQYLKDIIYPLLVKLKQEKLLDIFFFTNFNSPDFEFRFRVCVCDKRQLNHVLNELFKMVNSLFEEGYIETYSLLPYEREIERFGNIQTMSLAEKIFMLDSDISLLLINESITDKIGATVSISLDMINSMGLSEEDKNLFMKLYCFETPVQKDISLEVYEKYKNQHKEGVFYNKGNLNKDVNEKYIKINNKRSYHFNDYLKQYNNLVHKSTNNLEALATFIHLLCNRMEYSEEFEKNVKFALKRILLLERYKVGEKYKK